LDAPAARLWPDARDCCVDHSTQARRIRERLLQINTPFAETVRWKRCVPRGRFSLFQGVVNEDMYDSSD